MQTEKKIQPIGKLAIKIQLPRKMEAACEMECGRQATELLRDRPLCSICFVDERGKYEP